MGDEKGGAAHPLLHTSCIYLVMTIFGLMIVCTILHEGGHAFATLCAPQGRVRHIMLNPCCGGHAFVGHAGGELWEAWVAFAGPIWDISTAFLFYFIQVSCEDDGYARSAGLKDCLPMDNVKDLKLDKLIRDNTSVDDGQFTQHFLDDNAIFWRIALAMLMDLQFVTFCFNMLPIITLDGADFFGSFFRLPTNPMATAIFLIITSLTCILGLLVWWIVLPGINIYNRWDDITAEPKWADDEVKYFLFATMFIGMKMLGFMKPTCKLCGDACGGNKRLAKYHVFQVPKYERQQAKKRESVIPMYQTPSRAQQAQQYGVVNL